jgi:nucleoside-diphosphate-sugar epimerase
VYTLPEQDLLNISKRCQDFWPREKTILLTGGTGFFGRWMVESISMIESQNQFKNEYIIISRRSAESLQKIIPCLAQKFFKILTMDLNEISGADLSPDYILHAATDVTSVKSGEEVVSLSETSFNTILKWSQSRQFQKILYVSSGAVYEQSQDLAANESDPISNHHSSSYSASKKYIEFEIENKFKKSQSVIARCFSFLGPYVDDHMIAMQMVQKKINQEMIELSSPTAKRSYMYPTDLVTALYSLLFLPTQHLIYNLGSPDAILLKELAELIQVDYRLVERDPLKTSLAGKFYYPSTQRLESEFANLFTVKLQSAISKTIQFYNKMKEDNHDSV